MSKIHEIMDAIIGLPPTERAQLLMWLQEMMDETLSVAEPAVPDTKTPQRLDADDFRPRS